MPPPLAYFLSWTCYGQRLHGDERGSVDARHNLPGTPLLPHDPMREQRARERMKGETVLLTQDMRVVVESAVVQLCMERRWMLAARNVRSTHAHVVVDCRGELSPERALAQFKARATHALRQAGLVAPDTRLWTHHGSTRWINTYPGLYGAIIYVNEWQDGPNRRLLEEHRRQARSLIESFKEWKKTHRRNSDVADEPRTE